MAPGITFSAMDAASAFAAFVAAVLTADRAARFAALAANTKGHRKLLQSLDHDFERAVKANATRRFLDRNAACYAYHASVGFGVSFSSVAEALEHLDSLDGWLIVVADGSAGIYRPEARWDDTVELAR